MHNPKWSCIVKSIKFEDDSFMSIREKMGVAQYVQLHTTGHGNFLYYTPLKVPHPILDPEEGLTKKNVYITLGLTGEITGKATFFPLVNPTLNIDKLPPSSVEEIRSIYNNKSSNCTIWMYGVDSGKMIPHKAITNYFLSATKYRDDFPMMIVSPNSKMVLVSDLHGLIRQISLGDYDTFPLFMENGPGRWHQTDSKLMFLLFRGNPIPRFKDDKTPMLILNFIQSFSIQAIDFEDPQNQIEVCSFKCIEPFGEPSQELKKKEPKEYIGNCFWLKCQRPLCSDIAKVCSLCKTTMYCSKECQRNHWSAENGHQNNCPKYSPSPKNNL